MTPCAADTWCLCACAQLRHMSLACKLRVLVTVRDQRNASHSTSRARMCATHLTERCALAYASRSCNSKLARRLDVRAIIVSEQMPGLTADWGCRLASIGAAQAHARGHRSKNAVTWIGNREPALPPFCGCTGSCSILRRGTHEKCVSIHSICQQWWPMQSCD